MPRTCMSHHLCSQEFLCYKCLSFWVCRQLDMQKSAINSWKNALTVISWRYYTVPHMKQLRPLSGARIHFDWLTRFRLRATIDHHGPSIHSGHYTASINCGEKHSIATITQLRSLELLTIKLIISSLYVNSNWSYGPETVKLGFDLCDPDLWPWPFAWTSLLSLVIIGNTSWKFHDDRNMVKKVWWTDRRTDRQTDWTIHKAAWSQLKTRDTKGINEGGVIWNSKTVYTSVNTVSLFTEKAL